MDWINDRLFINKEAELKDLENSHHTHSVKKEKKNDKVWQEEITKDVAKDSLVRKLVSHPNKS